MPVRPDPRVEPACDKFVPGSGAGTDFWEVPIAGSEGCSAKRPEEADAGSNPGPGFPTGDTLQFDVFEVMSPVTLFASRIRDASPSTGEAPHEVLNGWDLEFGEPVAMVRSCKVFSTVFSPQDFPNSAAAPCIPPLTNRPALSSGNSLERECASLVPSFEVTEHREALSNDSVIAFETPMGVGPERIYGDNGLSSQETFKAAERSAGS